MKLSHLSKIITIFLLFFGTGIVFEVFQMLGIEDVKVDTLKI